MYYFYMWLCTVSDEASLFILLFQALLFLFFFGGGLHCWFVKLFLFVFFFFVCLFFCLTWSFIHPSHKMGAVKLWLSATVLLELAMQAAVVKTQKIKQDKLKVHLKDKEESWIIESPTLIKTVLKEPSNHVASASLFQSLSSSWAKQHTIVTEALGILTHSSRSPISSSGLFKVQRGNNVYSLWATYAVLIK